MHENASQVEILLGKVEVLYTSLLGWSLLHINWSK